MSIFSFHLAKAPSITALGALFAPPTASTVPGLRSIECFAVMTLGSPILSPARMQLSSLAVFCCWEREPALRAFLTDSKLGRTLAKGWHVRLELLRRWGLVSEFPDQPTHAGVTDPEAPVVAVTLARAKLSELARFTRWGKPVEELVRDHPGTTLALAAVRPPRTFSTFTVWRTEREMLDMVHGRGAAPGAKQHAAAMGERSRRDFHSEFTTLRFRALSEHGAWEARTGIVPPTIR